MYQWELHGKGTGSNPQGKKRSNSNKTSGTFHASETFPTGFESLPPGSMQSGTIDRLKSRLGFTALLPAQARCYSHIYKGTDAVLHSRTGTGKTLAFVLPLIERQLTDVERSRNARRGPFMVVLLPTVELSAQVQRVVTDVYGADTVAERKRKVQAEKQQHQQQQQGDDAGASSLLQLDREVVRCGTAGLDVTTQEQLAECDVLVGTVPAVDALLRLRKVVGGGQQKGQQQQQDEDDDSDDDEDEDDSDLEEFMNAEDEDTTNNNKDSSSASRRRQRSSNDEASAAKQLSKGRRKDNSNKKNSQKRKFVCSDGARYLRALVIDEVDHTLGPKFSTSARRVHNMVKLVRNGATAPDAVLQCVLVGATIPDWIQRVGFLGDPARRAVFRLVTAGTSKLPSGLKCFSVECGREQDVRVDMVCRLLVQVASTKRVVVFAPTKLVEAIAVAAREYEKLPKLTAAASASGSSPSTSPKLGAHKKGSSSSSEPCFVLRKLDTVGNSELDRLRVINEFNEGVANVLVCTDRACRGLDFTDVDTVICTSLPAAAPTAAETFVHRAGRAGRVGRAGNCVALFDPSNQGEMASKQMLESSTHVLFRPYDVTVSSLSSSRPVSGAAASPSQKGAKQPQGKAAATASASRVVVMRLKVKSTFRAAGGGQNINSAAASAAARPQQRGARELLETNLKSMSDELRAAVQIQPAKDEAPEIVHFTVPRALSEDVRQALWKFDVAVVESQ